MVKTADAQGLANWNGRRQLAVRMPQHIFDFVKREALQHNRSLSDQIVEMLDSYRPKPLAVADYESDRPGGFRE